MKTGAMQQATGCRQRENTANSCGTLKRTAITSAVTARMFVLTAQCSKKPKEEYQKAHQVIMALDLKPGEVVADIGAGSGYFSFASRAMLKKREEFMRSMRAPT